MFLKIFKQETYNLSRSLYGILHSYVNASIHLGSFVFLYLKDYLEIYYNAGLLVMIFFQICMHVLSIPLFDLKIFFPGIEL